MDAEIIDPDTLKELEVNRGKLAEALRVLKEGIRRAELAQQRLQQSKEQILK